MLKIMGGIVLLAAFIFTAIVFYDIIFNWEKY